MIEHNARLWFGISRAVEQLESKAAEGRDDDLAPMDLVRMHLRWIKDECQELGMPVSSQFAQELLVAGGGLGIYTNRALKTDIAALRKAMEAELASMLFMRVPSQFAPYYREQEPFGADFPRKFPSAILEVEGAAKAVAFGLGSAAMFHLMRTMEIGLKVLAKSLGIPYKPSWEAYLSEIEKRITANHKTKGVRWKRDQPFFRDLAGDLQRIKIVWRNPTMHIDKQYSQVEAEEVFRAVRFFMNRLGERFSE